MMRNLTSFAARLVGVSVLLSIQGCWMSAAPREAGDGSDTDADSDSDSDSDSESDSESEICDEQLIPIYNEATRMMILVDHSSSMAGGNWDIARDAIYDLMDTFAGTSLEFGLDVLPDADIGECSVSAPVVVDCGPDTEDAIAGELAGMTTLVSTPLYDALENFADPDYAPGCTTTEYEQYILLIADGEDSCGGPEVEAFGDLASVLADMGIGTMVVGFNIVMSSEQLNVIAANGGTDFTTYLMADDAPSLNAALKTVATTIYSCTISIASAVASANPGLVNFYFDDELVAMDADCASGSGWRWKNDEHTKVEFCPDSCELIGNGEVDEITATFGCDTVSE